MFVRIALFICAFGLLGVSGVAQRTVTNADLTRYRDDRVRAESELREQYARKGVSYDEVMRRNKESQKEMIELSAKLRAERLENERIAAELAARAWQAEAERRRTAATVYYSEPEILNGGWFSGYGYGYGGSRGRFRFGARHYQQPGYFAGGQFWPTGPATPPRPMFSVPGRHR